MKGQSSKQKLSNEYGKKVWILKDKKENIIDEFRSKENAIQFKKKYHEELNLERKP
jgi:hypothetical protein